MRCPDDYNVIFMDFPGDIQAAVRVDASGYPTVYINSALSLEARRKALRHELAHFHNGDFQNHLTIVDAETGAARAEDIAVMFCARSRPAEESYTAMLAAGWILFQAVDALPLPERLRQCRLAKRMTREALAARLGVTPAEVYRYETGTSTPTRSQLDALSAFYGVAI